MKTIKSQRRCLSLLSTAFMLVATAFGLASCEQYDLDERLPEDLGPSIYDYLVDNGFDTYVKLIDEPGLAGEGQSYHDVLSKTGSKTMFVANEDAVQRFYASGVFKKADGISNVTCYDELSLSQKKMLLFGAMLDNVYQSSALSNREDENGGNPITGDCMRRVSLLTEIYDTVTYMTPEQMPENAYWNTLRNAGEGIRIMTDATKRPRVMFTPKFLQVHKMTNDDYDFLFHHNDGKHRESNEVSINGVRIINPDNKCLNGFVHEMEDVVCPLPNMAEKINTLDNVKIFNSLLRRFCAPYIEFPYDGDSYGDIHTETFNKLYNTSISQIYQQRFFAGRSQPTSSVANGDSLYYTSIEFGHENVKDFVLKYDPGWNSYFPLSGSIDAALALQKDMGVMIVPNDEIMETWWNNTPLKERYGKQGDAEVKGVENVIADMADVPNSVIVELINNGMLSSLVSSVPSTFVDVLNDANDPMGIKVADIDDVQICCNGAVYVANKVFSPTTYRSVAFPTIVDESLKVIDWAIKNCHFKPYMNSMVSHYSFFIPKGRTVNGVDNCLVYLSPVMESAATKYGYVYVFYFDNRAKTVKADKYVYDPSAENGLGARKSSASDITEDEIKNILTDMLNYHIVLADVEEEFEFGTPSKYKFFKTKGGGTVKFEMEPNAADPFAAKRYAWGGYKLERGEAGANVLRTYDQRGTSDGNGRSYVIDEPLYAASNTVTEVLTDNVNYPKFSTFGKLLETSTVGEDNQYGGKNIGVFNTYNYTVYVPTNESIQKLIDQKFILLEEDIEKLRDYYENLAATYTTEEMQKIGMRLSQFMNQTEGQPYSATDSTYTADDYISDLEEELDNFIKYHIQDNSLYIGGEFEDNTNYETSYISGKVFLKLYVRTENNGEKLIVKDSESEHQVITDDPNYYNIMCREYQYTSAGLIETSSYAVIHQIDSPLDYGKVSKFGYGARNLYTELTK